VGQRHGEGEARLHSSQYNNNAHEKFSSALLACSRTTHSPPFWRCTDNLGTASSTESDACRFQGPCRSENHTTEDAPRLLELRLSHSGPVLERARRFHLQAVQTGISTEEELFERYTSNTDCKPFTVVSSRYLSLCDFEQRSSDTSSSTTGQASSSWCLNYANKIEAYVDTVGDADIDYPEFKSRQILSLMEMWTNMQSSAIRFLPNITLLSTHLCWTCWNYRH
jgi:hypothetical protein